MCLVIYKKVNLNKEKNKLKFQKDDKSINFIYL